MEQHAAGMFMVHQTIGNILCCKCGIPMQPNAANMCARCLRSEVDITEGLIKRSVVDHCPDCGSYREGPSLRIKAELESPELLAFCMKKLKSNLCGLKVTGADFIWTEPHSKRIKVKIIVQKEVLSGVILEQAYVVEFVQQERLCDACTRIQANPDQWVAVVQLRQHVSHRRTFFYLEQLILKHAAAARAIRIKQMHRGIDFFFANRSHAVQFVDFIGKVAPVTCHDAKQLVSHDLKSSNYNYKYTFSVEIAPICHEDLICLPRTVATSLGNIGPLVICTKVTNNLSLMDPFTLRYCFLDADQYRRKSFKPLLTSRQLVEYIVLDVEITSPEVTINGSRYAMADAQVARLSDFGKNDTIFSVKTHLGHLLKPGDHALGYDLHGANSNDIELDMYKASSAFPEAILIKKSYEEKRQRKRGKPRAWKLKSLGMEAEESRGRQDGDKMNSEYEEFLRDLEENPELRFNISLYRNKEYQASEMASMTDGEEDVPSVPLDELLADLDITDAGDEDDAMSV